MFMDNKALLDQLMGTDRNAPTFQGLREQWKDPSMCKAHIVDFCPSELFYNTKMFLGNCNKTHSDVVKQQYDESRDPEKVAWTRKQEFELLSHLERIIDSVEQRIRRQQERVNANVPEYRLSKEKEIQLGGLNSQISIAMKEVERLAEAGMFDESTLLMSKVTELTNKANEIKEDKYSQVVKKEVVCQVCGVLTGAGVDEDGRPERPHDHIRGKQHAGMERVRIKVIELKNKYNLSKSKRDKEFTPSPEIERELRLEGLVVPVANDTTPGEGEIVRNQPSRSMPDRNPNDQDRARWRRQRQSRSRSRSFERRRNRPPPRRSRSPSGSDKCDEFGRRRPKQATSRVPYRERNVRNSSQQRRARSASSSSARSVKSAKSLVSVTFD